MANLTGQSIKDTYQDLVTVGSGNTITDGTGSLIENLVVTASYATNAISASYAPIDTAFSSSVAFRLTTDESNISANASAIAGLNAETGSYLATGSVSNNVITLEKVDGSSFTLTVDTGSAAGDVTALSASLSTRLTVDEGLISGNAAAIIINSNDIASLTAATSSYVTTAQTSSMSVLNAVSASIANSATTALLATTASYAVTASYASTADAALTATSASYAVNATSADSAIIAASAISASYANNASTADSATSASYAADADTLDGLDSTEFAILANNNVFSGNQTFNDITVNGTGSFAYIESVTGSAKIIGDAFIILNNDTPAERYAGIKVIDSGSATATTASLLFDGLTNDWFYEYEKAGDPDDFGVFLAGPEYGTIGSPAYPTNNKLQKGQGDHHLADSLLTDDGTNVSMTGDFQVTGGVTASAAIRANGGVITQTVVAVSSQLDLGTLGSGDVTITSAGGDIIVTGSIDSLNDITAPTFIGALQGNADTATSASHALNADNAISSSFAVTASYVQGGTDPFPYTGNPSITGDLSVTGSYLRLSGSFSGSAIDNITDVYTSTEKVEHVVSLTQAEYNAVSGSADPNTLYYITDAPTFSGFPYTGSAQITGSLGVTGSIDVLFSNQNRVGTLTSGSFTGSFITNIVPSASIVEPQVERVITLTQDAYTALSSSALVSDNSLYIISDAEGEVITSNLVITGSVRGEVNALSIASLQAEIDCATGNFFTLTLAASVDTEIIFANVEPGQTINLQITQNDTTAGTVSFGGNVLFSDGTAFAVTTTLDAIDVMTFISFDGTNVLATGIKNFTI